MRPLPIARSTIAARFHLVALRQDRLAFFLVAEADRALFRMRQADEARIAARRIDRHRVAMFARRQPVDAGKDLDAGGLTVVDDDDPAARDVVLDLRRRRVGHEVAVDCSRHDDHGLPQRRRQIVGEQERYPHPRRQVARAESILLRVRCEHGERERRRCACARAEREARADFPRREQREAKPGDHHQSFRHGILIENVRSIVLASYGKTHGPPE